MQPWSHEDDMHLLDLAGKVTAKNRLARWNKIGKKMNRTGVAVCNRWSLLRSVLLRKPKQVKDLQEALARAEVAMNMCKLQKAIDRAQETIDSSPDFSLGACMVCGKIAVVSSKTGLCGPCQTKSVENES